MPVSLRQEHRDATRSRIVAAARKTFVKKGYVKATIDEIISAAGVSRATLYLHFDSKYALLSAALENLSLEGNEAARRLSVILVEGGRAELREWIEWALEWCARNRPIALAAQEAELSTDKPAEPHRMYLECVEPWVETWPSNRRDEARMRFELCRLQMHHYMWGNSHILFADQEPPIDVFTEIWWNTLKAPLLHEAPRDGR
jgi:AcrR family transcriptional regulator